MRVKFTVNVKEGRVYPLVQVNFAHQPAWLPPLGVATLLRLMEFGLLPPNSPCLVSGVLARGMP